MCVIVLTIADKCYICIRILTIILELVPDTVRKVCNMFRFNFKRCDCTHHHHLPFLAEPLQEDVNLVGSIRWCLRVAVPFCLYPQWTAVVIQCLVLASQVAPPPFFKIFLFSFSILTKHATTTTAIMIPVTMMTAIIMLAQSPGPCRCTCS